MSKGMLTLPLLRLDLVTVTLHGFATVKRSGMPHLRSAVLDVRSLDKAVRDSMFSLFSRCYAATSTDRFERDLSEKDSVILLCGPGGAICGFSTLVTFPFRHEGRDLRIVFSGDTIIDRAYWGSQTFSSAWIRHIGKLARQAPELPLYWLLIVKGHRTYRYLPAFGIKFVPDWRGIEDSRLMNLRDSVARARFGEAYDAETGLVRHAHPQGHLAAEYADISERELKRVDVRYFLERNPGHAQGDELVCLCELGADNMRPLTRRLFEQGFAE
jgi:hypothetical protein